MYHCRDCCCVLTAFGASRGLIEAGEAGEAGALTSTGPLCGLAARDELIRPTAVDTEN